MKKTYSPATTCKAMALVVFALALFCGPGPRAVAQDSSPERRQNIRRLLEITKAVELSNQVGEQAIAELKRSLAQLPANAGGQISPEVMERITDVFEEEMRKEFAAEKVISSITPIYEKYLSDDDVKALIVFYESPLGKKVIDVLPQIMSEAFENGALRGQEAALRAIERLRVERILPSPAQPEPAAKPPRRSGARRGRRRN
jgi:hypothetical protein